MESCILFRLIRPWGWWLVTGRWDVVTVDPWDEGFGTSQSNDACVISAGVLAQSPWQAAVRLQILIFYNVVLVFEWMDLKSCLFVTGAAVWSLSWGQMTGSHQSNACRKGGGGSVVYTFCITQWQRRSCKHMDVISSCDICSDCPSMSTGFLPLSVSLSHVCRIVTVKDRAVD